MKFKRILSLCLITAIIVSCLNSVFASNDVVLVSDDEDTVIKSLCTATGWWTRSYPPDNANDNNENTAFWGKSTDGGRGGLIIELKKEYKISHAEVSFATAPSSYTVLLSKTYDYNTNDLTNAVSLTVQNGKFYLPEAYQNEKFKYAILDVPSLGTSYLKVKEFKVYAKESMVEVADNQLKQLPEIQEIGSFSIGKKALAKNYGDGGYNSKATDAVDGNSDTIFISANVEEDWLRVDMGEAVKISHLEITGWFQFDAKKIDTKPEFYEVAAFNEELSYTEDISNYSYVELMGGFDGEIGTFNLPDDKKNEKFRYFQIRKPKVVDENDTPILDAMLIREFAVYVDAKDLTVNSALNKPVIYDGDIDYCNALTNGSEADKVIYENAVIDLLTPSLIKDIVAVGDNTEAIAFYGGVENADVSNLKLIKDNPNEMYRYIYVDNQAGAGISEVKVNTYSSDIIGVWYFDEQNNSYSLDVKNGYLFSDRTYTAIVSQLNAYGEVLTVDYETVTLAREEEHTFEFTPKYVYGAEKVVCNVLRDDVISLTDPTVFIDGKIKKNIIISDGEVIEYKDLSECMESYVVNNGIKFTVKAKDYIEETDVYNIIVYNPKGDKEYLPKEPKEEYEAAISDGEDEDGKFNYVTTIIGYISENAGNADAVYEYVVSQKLPTGQYEAVISITNADLITRYSKYKFSNVHPSENEKIECIDAFKLTDGSNFEELYNDYYAENRVIDFSEIFFVNKERNAEIFARMGSAFVWARDNMSKWNAKSTIENTEDILTCFKMALVLDSAMNSDISLYDSLQLFSGDISKIFTENYKSAAELYIRKYADTDYEAALNNLINCNALASIKGKAVSQIVEGIKKYSEELKVDIDRINEDEIDIYEIAKRLDNSIPDSYYDGLSAEINTIIPDIPQYEQPDSDDEDSPSTDRGNDGGTSFSVIPTPEKTAEPKQEETPIANFVVYSDVSDNHWAKSNIEKLSQMGILKGTGGNRFEPDRQITRAEFVKVVVSAFKMTTNPDTKLTFKDCDVNDWFYPYVDAGVSNKIISGVSADEFCPDKNILRQDAAVILDNVLLYLGYAMPEQKAVSFTDTNAISPYAIEAVKLLVDCEIINGMDDGSFAPKGELTRAQAATLIVKLLDFVGGEVNR